MTCTRTHTHTLRETNIAMPASPPLSKSNATRCLRAMQIKCKLAEPRTERNSFHGVVVMEMPSESQARVHVRACACVCTQTCGSLDGLVKGWERDIKRGGWSVNAEEGGEDFLPQGYGQWRTRRSASSQ